MSATFGAIAARAFWQDGQGGGPRALVDAERDRRGFLAEALRWRSVVPAREPQPIRHLKWNGLKAASFFCRQAINRSI